MNGATLVSDFRQLPLVQRALRDVAERATDASDLTEEIGNLLQVSTRDRFETQTDPEGRRWQMLSAETVLARAGGRRKVYTAKGGLRKPAARKIAGMLTLVVEGILRDSITHVAGPDFVEVGSNDQRARIHQFGGQAGRGRKVTIPARPYLGLSADDEAAIVAAAQDHLRGPL
ncbi:MAG: phage virion morphogenesis protein [Pseudomonadota bacterium]